MPTLLIKNASILVRMDDQRREVEGGDLLARDGVIAEIGVGLDHGADTVVDAAGCAVTPGLVNTHHHLFQTRRACRDRPARRSAGQKSRGPDGLSA